MSRGFDRMRDEHIKALIGRNTAQRRRDRDTVDMAEAIRHGSPLPRHIEPEKTLPDVPLHKRGFGVMDEDVR
jgi:hypothetical protein